jgi:multiple sugar transport system substrate-binding protein
MNVHRRAFLRRSAAWGAGAAGAAALGACGVGGSEAPRADVAPATVQYTYWSTGASGGVQADWVKTFNASQSRVTATAANVTQDYWPTMIAQAVAGSGSDLWQGQSERFPELVGRGLTLNVERYLKRDARSMNTGDYAPFALEQYRFNKDRRTLFEGDSYGIPYMTTLGMFYYNLDVVQQVGAKPPPRDGNWTWDDFLALTKAVTRVRADQTLERGAFFLHTNWAYHLMWVWSFGGDYLSKDQTRWVLNSPESRAAFQTYVDYRYKHHVAPVPNVDFVGQNSTDLFVNGSVALLLGNTGNQTTLKDRNPAFRWDIAHWPKGKAGPATFLAGDAVIAWSGTKHPEAAWEFMKYSAGVEAEERYGREGIHMPSRKSVVGKVFAKPETPWQEEINLEALRYARLRPITVDYVHYTQVMDKYFGQIINNQTSVAEALEKVQQAVDYVLKNHDLPGQY